MKLRVMHVVHHDETFHRRLPSVVILAFAVPAKAGNKVTRPWSEKGHAVVLVDVTEQEALIYPWTSVGTGVSTHLGRVTLEGAGAADFNPCRFCHPRRLHLTVSGLNGLSEVRLPL